MRKYFSFLLFLSSLLIQAQEESSHNNYWYKSENMDAMIGAKNCYVRSKPSTNGDLLDSLQMGKEVRVLSRTEDFLKLKGIRVSWAQIKYLDVSGKEKSGYVWLGFLALDYVKTKENIFLTALDKIEKRKISEDYETDHFWITVKVLDTSHQIVEQKTSIKPIGESYYFENKLIGGLGLKNLEDIYRFSFSGEACGIPTFYFYYGWTGKKLLELPEKEEVGDAGAYYRSERFIFPDENGGKPDFIFKIIEDAENVEESDNILNVTLWKEVYTWDGQKATFKMKEKPKKFKKKF